VDRYNFTVTWSYWFTLSFSWSFDFSWCLHAAAVAEPFDIAGNCAGWWLLRHGVIWRHSHNVIGMTCLVTCSSRLCGKGRAAGASFAVFVASATRPQSVAVQCSPVRGLVCTRWLLNSLFSVLWYNAERRTTEYGQWIWICWCVSTSKKKYKRNH